MMISLHDISSSNSMEQILNQKLLLLNDYLYPFNEFTSHYLLNKKVSQLRTLINNSPSSSLTISFYKDAIDSLTFLERQNAKLYIESFSISSEQIAYLYLNSKTSFRSFFADFLPSAFDHLYNYLTSNSYIRQVGSGYGTAIVFLPSIFNSDFSNYSLPQDVFTSDVFSLISNQLKYLQEDNSYLKSSLDQKDETINQLLQTIERLNREKIISSQLTWH